MGEQRKTNANRHGARGLRKLREARTRKPTNFVPEDVDRAREDDIESTQKRRRYISSEKTIGEKKEGRKEGRKDEVGGAEEKVRARETSLSACHRDRFNEKNVRSRPEIDSRGEVAYIPGSSSLFVCFVFARATLRRPRSRSLSSSSSSSSFFPPPPPLIVFLHFTTALRYSDIGIACYSASSLSASFDPLNLAGGRPAISRKLVKSRTY